MILYCNPLSISSMTNSTATGDEMSNKLIITVSVKGHIRRVNIQLALRGKGMSYCSNLN